MGSRTTKVEPTPSIPQIRQLVSPWIMKRTGGQAPVFPVSWEKTRWPKQGVVDVVLFVDTVSVLKSSSRWPKNLKYRLWLLSGHYREVMRKLFPFQRSQLGEIPRAEIFPLSKKLLCSDGSGGYDLVFSGRMLRIKHFSFVAEVVRYLQWRLDDEIPIRFLICNPKLAGGDRVQAILKAGWKRPPVLLGDLGTDWIHQYHFRNPILIQLSVQSKEDFGVSVGQAETLGWPMFLSDWGPHKDVRGQGVLKIPARWILQRDLEKVVDFVEIAIRRKDFKKNTRRKAQIRNKGIPTSVTFQQIQSVTRKFEKKNQNAWEFKKFMFDAMSSDFDN